MSHRFGIFLVLIFFAMKNAFPAMSENGVYNDIPAYEADYLSPEVIKNYGQDSFVVTARTGDKLLVIKNDVLEKSITLSGHPSGVEILGDTAFVTIAKPEGLLEKVDLKSGKVINSFYVGHMPRAPLLSADKKHIYILNQFTAEIKKINIDSGKTVSLGKAIREPFSQVLSKDAKKLYVLNLLPESKGGLYEENIGAAISVLDAETLKNISTINLPNGSINTHKIVLSPDGMWLYASAVIARFNVPTSQVERGWVNTNAICVIDAEHDKFYAAFLLDNIDLGAAGPYGIAISPDGKTLAVAQSGTHEVSVIDRDKLHKKLDDVLGGKTAVRSTPTASDPENDLSFLFDMRTRIAVGGFAPRYLAYSADYKIYTPLYYSDKIAKIDPQDVKKNSFIDIGGNEEMTLIRKGDLYFHDGAFCFQKWLSCSTCHTEVRSDALNWDLMNDGIGNPKQSKSLLFAHFTPPSMITGIRKNAETAVRKGLRFIQFVERPEADAVAIDAYLKSLKPVSSPYLGRDGSLSESAKNGEIIFEVAKCSQCHSGEYYTDMLLHNVGTGLDEYAETSFDTPTLIEIWRTAPYLYDGRARTLFDVLKKFNTSDKHGHTSDLTDEELKDLEAYLLTL